ncbi:unnamed protein product [Parnassius mnemosyne]|uniref:Nuclease HARBI1 n=1 Tax=Parnassius mnemosyne TaxID=213953 RepID=A0AAV1KRG1_9NEOP
MVINTSKCVFGASTVTFLGYTVSPEGVKSLTSKVQAIKDFPVPKNVKELRRFLGMLNFRFVPGAAETQAPLNSLLTGAVKGSHPVNITGDALIAFEKCKEDLCNATLLAYPDLNSKLRVVTDASDIAIGGVLQQFKDVSDEYEIFEFLEEDNKSKIVEDKIERAILRSQMDSFSIDDDEFIKRYRLSKNLVLELCDDLRPFMTKPAKFTDLSIETKILIALSFYATGSYQRPIGDIAAHSVPQQTVSAVLGQVTQGLNMPQLRSKYIRFPRDAAQRRANILRFYNKFGMPGVLGCIDCTHVAMVRPSQNEERYYCRKQYHSLNVQLICNADMDIISVDASYGGASHDAFIWSNHPLKTHMEDLSTSDSGYPLRRYLMTPIVDAPPNTPEGYYTDMHVRARNVIERTIGLMKARFRCLLVHRVLHYEPHMAASIVNACVILHNICNKANVSVEELQPEEALREYELQQLTTPRQDSAVNSRAAQNPELREGITVRNNLIDRLWRSRSAT